MEYLSQATIVGFFAAAALGIGLQQLKGLLGIVNFTNKLDVFSVVKSLRRSFTNRVRNGQQNIELNVHYLLVALIINISFTNHFQSELHAPYNFIIGFSFLCFIIFTRLLVSNVAIFFIYFFLFWLNK